VNLIFFTGFLLHDLTVKFLLDEATALLLPHYSLLLFFVVEQSVELLDSSPLVILCDLTVNFSSGMLARQLAEIITFLTLAGLEITRRLGAVS
jgi:hypothetical protein